MSMSHDGGWVDRPRKRAQKKAETGKEKSREYNDEIGRVEAKRNQKKKKKKLNRV